MLVFPLFWLMGLGRISAGVPVLHALYLDEFGHIKADDKPYGLFLGHVCILKQFQLVKATNKKIDRFSGHLPRTEKNRNRCMFYLFINGTLHLYNNNDHFELNYNTTLPEFENRMRHVVSRFRRRSLDVRTMTVIQGKTAKLLCPYYDRSKGKITWLKDGSVLPDSHRQVIDLDGSLIVQGVNENPDEGTYRCQYQVDKGREISYLIELKIIESPVISEFQFSPSSEVGMRMKVICAAILGDPPFQFRWLKDGDQLPISLGLSIQKFKDYSMLSTDNMQLKHGGNYTCQVTNEGGTASYSAVLKVNAPPRWVVEPKNTEVVEGGSARFDCSATGSPPPTIKWTKSTSESIPEDYTPVYNSHKHTLYPNGSLIIHRASEQEKGHYLCEATNGFGFDLSKLVHLKIHYPPKFEVKFKTHAVNKGDSVVLSVVARGDPPIQFFWEKGVYRIENDLRYRIETSESQNTAQKSTLTIIDTIREDSGIYTCSAKNHYGKDETRLQLLIQEAPGPPVNISVTNTAERTASLSWSTPYNGNSAISRYMVIYYKVLERGDSPKLNVTTEGALTSTVILALDPAALYRAYVMAQNGVGWSNSSAFVEFMTEEEAPSGPPEDVKVRATGPNSVKVSWKPPKQKDWNGKIRGYYIGYRLARNDKLYLYKKIDTNDLHTQKEVHLTNLQRSTVYLVSVQAFNTKGVGPRSDEVEVKTLEDVPPSAPDVKVLSVTTSSVTISWSQKATFGKAVTDYVLHFRQSKEPWEEIPIKTHDSRYTVTNLICGTTYQFFLTAHNSVGKSEPSNIITTRTAGSAPLFPAYEEFLSIQQTEITLHLSKWQNGGCPILSFTVRIRKKFHTKWRTISEEYPGNKPQFLISHLVPSTWYEVLVIIRNSAGATDALYDFKTLNLTREVVIHNEESALEPSSTSFVTNLEVMVPVIVSSFVILVVIIVGCVLCFRERQTRNNRTEGVSHGPSGKLLQDTIQLKEMGTPPALDTASSEEGTQRSSSQSQSIAHYPLGQPLYGSRPEEGHPYATPYDTLPVPPVGGPQHHPSSSGVRTIDRRGIDKRVNNIYSRQEDSPIRQAL